MTSLKVILLFSLIYGLKAGVIMNSTRRILQGTTVGETRPYMVYLRPAPAELANHDPNWLCGGVIIHERYVLTSAACIEDIKHFYVISGTNKWIPPTEENNCIKYGKKKAVWKCEPTSYFFDGQDFDNMRWMSNDIAVVKTEDDFNFSRKVKGCDYSPKKIAFNNVTVEKEKAGTMASIAGWGSIERFGDMDRMLRSSENSKDLLETEVKLISKKNCKKRWPERYHGIIDDSMICAKDGMDSEIMPAPCAGEVNCKGLMYSDEVIEDEDEKERRRFLEPNSSVQDTRRTKSVAIGGFCENDHEGPLIVGQGVTAMVIGVISNDHGGPLVVGQGATAMVIGVISNDHGGPLVVGQGSTAMVIGVISASQTHEVSSKCYGPYLFSSVWKNRHLLSCAIDKERWGETCRRLLKTLKTQMTETNFDWSAHPDGPAKQENEVQGDKTEKKEPAKLVKTKR